MEQIIRIGTRGSQLAIYQANVVKEELEKKFPGVHFQIVVIKTKGDKILDVPLSKIGDKGLFTKELEVAMFDNEIDMAVHSLKDLPTSFPEGVVLGAVLKRGEVRDALISTTKRSIQDLTVDDVIATSSLRRKAQLLRINKDFKIVEIRGNVNTRIRKMEEGFCTVMVMAGAGLQRLGMDHYISELIDPSVVIPACSQGAIAIEIRENDEAIAALVDAINDPGTLTATNAERAFLRTLEGGCQIPVGSHSRITGDQFEITGFIASIDGTEYLCKKEEGPVGQAVAISVKLAEKLLSLGGRDILKAIRLEDPFAPGKYLPLKDKVFISTRAVEAGDTLPDLLKAKGATLLSLPMIEIRTVKNLAKKPASSDLQSEDLNRIASSDLQSEELKGLATSDCKSEVANIVANTKSASSDLQSEDTIIKSSDCKSDEANPSNISNLFKQLNSYDWLFFTSRNGVAHFFRLLIDHTGSSELPASLKIAVVGAKTASELEYYGYSPTFTGISHGSSEMATEFCGTHHPRNCKILLALGNLADDTLKTILGADNQVDRIDVYETREPKSVDNNLIQRIKDSQYDLILFTSPSTFHHFSSFFDDSVVKSLKIASIGTTTSRAIQEAGLTPLLTATMSNVEGLTEAIVKYYQQV
jgi:hydroxymethylbilane synthase